MKVLVAGAGGMLGRDFVLAATNAGHDVVGFERARMDVTDADAVRRQFAREQPDLVVNCAAWTDVDGAETAEAEAFAVNGAGAGNVAGAAHEVDAAVLYVSTDYVFDGEKGAPYVESDQPAPLSAYARTKLAGEEATAAANRRHFVVRSSGLFGIHGKNFVATMLPMAERAAKRIGVDPRYLVAQAALETGWGKKMIAQRDGSSSHNLFGIKSGSSWRGDSARALTSEYENGKQVKEVASFRAYNSFEQSFQDYVSFLQNNDRYQGALDSAARPEQFMKELQRAGYATDPQYARKVSQIARQVQVYQTVAMADAPTRTL